MPTFFKALYMIIALRGWIANTGWDAYRDLISRSGKADEFGNMFFFFFKGNYGRKKCFQDYASAFEMLFISPFCKIKMQSITNSVLLSKLDGESTLNKLLRFSISDMKIYLD